MPECLTCGLLMVPRRRKAETIPDGCVQALNATKCIRCYKREYAAKKAAEKRLEEQKEPKQSLRDAFVEDYEFLRSHGVSGDELLRRLGVSRHVFDSRVARWKIPLFLDPDAQKVASWIKTYVDRGEVFTVDSLPFVSNPASSYWTVISQMTKSGFIKKVGERNSRLTGNTVVEWGPA